MSIDIFRARLPTPVTQGHYEAECAAPAVCFPLPFHRCNDLGLQHSALRPKKYRNKLWPAGGQAVSYFYVLSNITRPLRMQKAASSRRELRENSGPGRHDAYPIFDCPAAF